jgi:hypothetical protein
MGRKLRDVRIELQARLGFGATDQSQLAPILNSFITEAQEQIYLAGYWRKLREFWDLTAAAGTGIVAYPVAGVGGQTATLNTDKIESVWVDIGAGSAYWVPVVEGITPGTYNDTALAYPRRYEKREDGFELAPERDVAYTIRVFGHRTLGQLRDDDDTLDVNDRLVFVVALSYAKAHYKHSDAKEYLGKASKIFSDIRWANSSKLIKAGEEEEAEPRPVVV